MIAGQEFENEDELFAGIEAAFNTLTGAYIRSLFQRWENNF